MMLLLVLALALPNPARTPGVIRPLTTTQVCSIRWGRDRRHVTKSMKQRVFAAYGIPWFNRRLYEVDHLIPRELGGADDVRNLWPQPWRGPHNAHIKDQIENQLHRAVCRGEIPLVKAQHLMQTWGR